MSHSAASGPCCELERVADKHSHLPGAAEEVVCVGIDGAVRVRRVNTAPVLYLIVGLPGAGKRTLARRIADEHGILRLTPDEWMAPLFGHSDADGRRDILEGRMIWVAHQVLVSGASVDADHDRFLALCQPPSSAELIYADIPEPPSGYENWLHWASNRWPTLPRLDQGAQ